MSVLKDAGNLILGNGDLFLASTVAGLPSIAAYKAAVAAGTVGSLSGNVGAIKGTASMQIQREIVAFEVGVPLLVADQTVVREGIHLKVALAEMSLGTIQTQLGGGLYTSNSNGATLASAEPHSLSTGIGTPLAFGPVLYTTSTPAATANPVVTLAAGLVTGGAIPITATGSGAGDVTVNATTIVPGSTTTITVNSETDGHVYSFKIGNIYTVTYTSQTSDTPTLVATGIKDAFNSVTHTGSVGSPFVTAAVAATSASAVVTLNMTAFLQGYDYLIDAINDVIILTGNSSATTGSYLVTYYYNQASNETLTMGGQSSVTTSALLFIHPYKDGRVMALTIYKANPTGSVTLPFEEIAYSFAEFEMRAVADFSKGAGNQLYSLYREIPLT